jgi:hypothetical protein
LLYLPNSCFMFSLLYLFALFVLRFLSTSPHYALKLQLSVPDTTLSFVLWDSWLRLPFVRSLQWRMSDASYPGRPPCAIPKISRIYP